MATKQIKIINIGTGEPVVGLSSVGTCIAKLLAGGFQPLVITEIGGGVYSLDTAGRVVGDKISIDLLSEQADGQHIDCVRDYVLKAEDLTSDAGIGEMEIGLTFEVQ